MIDKLAFGVDERAGPDQLGQCEAQQPCGLFQELGFGHGEFFERIDFGALEEALRGLLGRRSRPGAATLATGLRLVWTVGF